MLFSCCSLALQSSDFSLCVGGGTWCCSTVIQLLKNTDMDITFIFITLKHMSMMKKREKLHYIAHITLC